LLNLSKVNIKIISLNLKNIFLQSALEKFAVTVANVLLLKNFAAALIHVVALVKNVAMKNYVAALFVMNMNSKILK
jgi:hypothetical protein